MKKNDSVSLSSSSTAGTCFKMSYETQHIYITSSEMQNIFEYQPSSNPQTTEDYGSTDEDQLLHIA